jgi:hypothetical protein
MQKGLRFNIFSFYIHQLQQEPASACMITLDSSEDRYRGRWGPQLPFNLFLHYATMVPQIKLVHSSAALISSRELNLSCIINE